MDRRSVIALTLLPATGLPVLAAPRPRPDPSVAVSWLQLLDAELYSVGWAQAAARLRQGTSPQAWQQALGTQRATLGPLQARHLLAATLRPSDDGPVDAALVTHEFRARFARGVDVRESVTLMHEAGSGWRVAAYRLREGSDGPRRPWVDLSAASASDGPRAGARPSRPGNRWPPG